ncbi:ATP-binding protein [Spirosoma sp. KNUC1025]|uniref:ATP-binding protein n=1 Tax=Spirosoma sp. KNUC1025 TaxID=2894082 RepID=UPI00386FAF64|nr:ATP-binding protein [Spirosoma sp. KNUC1025]
MVKIQHSPFQFLDPYDKDDKHKFFGRETEVNRLYQFVCGTNCMLVYGPSGVGKTSIIQCGLANRFQQSSWQDLHIRRYHNINESLRKAISDQLINEVDDIDSVDTFGLLQHLYLDYFKPIYLIFDQLEELYIIGNSEERALFTATLKKIVTNTSIKCKVILVMREEFIARLSKLEMELPVLKQMRMRIEAMSDDTLTNVVIPKTCKQFSIDLDPSPHQVAEAIVHQVKGHDTAVNLPYLQLYLDRLWHNATEINSNDDEAPIIFSEQLVEQTGDVGHVLGSFLDTQQKAVLKELRRKHPDLDIPDDLPRRVVDEFVTPEGTKLQRQGQKLRIAGIPPMLVQSAILELVDARIIRQEQDRGGDSDNDVYELAHDALAHHIHAHRTDTELGYVQIKDYIERAYQLTNRQGVKTKRFLNEDELASAHTHRIRLKDELEPEVWSYVDQSKHAHEDELQRDLKEKLEKEKNRKLRSYRVAGLAGVALLIVIYLYVSLQNTKKSLLKDESSRLVQQLDDYETEKAFGDSTYEVGKLYDNPTLIRQIAAEAAGLVEGDTNERAKEWILRLKKSKNDNFFYQLSLDTHLASPITGFTEDGKLFAVANPDKYLTDSTPISQKVFSVWTIDSSGRKWAADSADASAYTLVSIKHGSGKPLVKVLTKDQLDVLQQFASEKSASRKQGLHLYQLTGTTLPNQSIALIALSINGQSKQALLGFSNGQVYRQVPGKKVLDSLGLPAVPVEKILFPHGSHTVMRIKKNTDSQGQTSQADQLASTYLIERLDINQYDQGKGELTNIRELPNLSLHGISASAAETNPEFLLGHSPAQSRAVVNYIQASSTTTSLLGHNYPVSGTDFSPDQHCLLTTDTSGILRVYSTNKYRDNLPVANLLAIEKANLGMPLTRSELVDALFKASDWNRLTQNLFKAEEHYHRDKGLTDDFSAMLHQIGDSSLLRQQKPANVYRFWLRLLPNLEDEVNTDVAARYDTLSTNLKTYLQDLPYGTARKIIGFTEQNRYQQQASGIVSLFAAWAKNYPRIISDTLLLMASQMVEKDLDTMKPEDVTNVQAIINITCRQLKPSTEPRQFYQLHELIYQLDQKTGAQKPYISATNCLAERLSLLPDAAFDRIKGLDYLLATKDQSGHWWSILAQEYERRNQKDNDYRILIYGSLSFYRAMEGNYKLAIEAAQRGLALTPVDRTTPTDWIKSNLALALLMDGQVSEAKTIYQDYKDKLYTSYRYRNSNIQFRQAFLDDFLELEISQKGHLTPTQKASLTYIRRMLQPKAGPSVIANP